MTDSSIEPEALSTEQAARFCGLSRSFFMLQIQLGIGPRKLKIGKRALFLKSDLRAWLEAQVQQQGEVK